jgi:aspartate aminotransferase
MNDEYLKRRNLFLDALKDQNILIPFKPQAAFYLWCQVKEGVNASELSEMLANAGIGNAPGDCFGESHSSIQSIRFAFSCSTEMIQEGIGPLKEFLRRI